MAWVLLLILLIILMVLTFSGKDQVAWSRKLRRVNAGATLKAEWMAPDEVVQQVCADYLAAMRWLQEDLLDGWAYQSVVASTFLTGNALKRHLKVCTLYAHMRMPQVIGILRADHQVEVRQFSEDGERCLVIDNQTQRRMATYDYRTKSRLHTQDLGDGVVVYQMVYDLESKRWKIEDFIQELPGGWAKHSRHIQLISTFPTRVGRDN